MKTGERIGDYEVVEVLGNGGMGEVYKVRNVLSERVEAMKVLLPNLAGDPELAERFLREIKLQASLDHPNIAKLHTAFRDSNQLLMVMEFVEGLSIEKLLAHGPLLMHDAVSYAGQVLGALAYAHGHGVVHRDIKPANLMRMPSGTIKLLDFGIAHLKKSDHKLTKTGTTLGSLYYIAPELINGSEPDPRCDIYSLGVVLYEMVTGHKPFQGDSQYSIMTAHMQGMPVAPSDAVPWVPKPLNDVILRAMAKDPADRFQSAEAFQGALENAPAPDEAATQVMPAAPTQALPTATAPVATAPPPPTQVIPPPPPAEATAAAPPPAQPVATPAATPPAAMAAPMPPPQSSSSHRGLYVALGCILTLGVLAAAAIEGPRFFKTHADQPATAREKAPAQENAAPTTPASPNQDQAPTTTSVSAPDDKSSPPTPVTEGQASPANQATSGQSDTTQAASVRPPRVKPAAQESQEQPSSQPRGPSAEAQESYRTQMAELQEQAEQLNIRAKTAKTGLSSIKSQMATQGLGLRSDVLEAEARMNYLLGKAQQEIAKGDAISAEHDLQMAGYAIESIEKFLGH